MNLGRRTDISMGNWTRYGIRKRMFEALGIRKSGRNYLGENKPTAKVRRGIIMYLAFVYLISQYLTIVLVFTVEDLHWPYGY